MRSISRDDRTLKDLLSKGQEAGKEVQMSDDEQVRGQISEVSDKDVRSQVAG